MLTEELPSTDALDKLPFEDYEGYQIVSADVLEMLHNPVLKKMNWFSLQKKKRPFSFYSHTQLELNKVNNGVGVGVRNVNLCMTCDKSLYFWK